MFKRNIIYLIVTIVVVFLAYKSYNKTQKILHESSLDKMYLTASQVESIKGFEFIKGKEKISVDYGEKKGWAVSSDDERITDYPANMSLIKKIVQKMNSENFEKVDSKKKYAQSYNIKIKMKEGSPKTLKVFTDKSFDQQVFLESEGQRYISEPFWLETMLDFEFRQKEIFLLDHGLRKVFLQQKNRVQSFTFQEKDSVWLSDQVDNKTVTDLKMTQFLKTLMQVKIFRFFDNESNVRSDRYFGLDQPTFKLKFVYSSSQPAWEIRISAEDDQKYYGKVEHLGTYFQLSRFSIDQLRKSFNLIN